MARLVYKGSRKGLSKKQRSKIKLFGSSFPNKYAPLTFEDIDYIPDITIEHKKTKEVEPCKQ